MKSISIIAGSLIMCVTVAMILLAEEELPPAVTLQKVPQVSNVELTPVKDIAAPKVPAEEERRRWAADKAAREAALPNEEEIVSISRILNKPYYYDEIGNYWMRRLEDEQLHSVFRDRKSVV